MNNHTTIEIDDITVNFMRHRFSRHITIRVVPFKGVRVTVPAAASYKDALDFVVHKKDWIKNSLCRMRRIEDQHKLFNDSVDRVDMDKAREMLKVRLDQIARANGFSYNRLFVRRQKTLWGSCSARRDISLNACLSVLPAELMDYVIVHELVHTVVRSHNRDFWERVMRIVPQAAMLRRKLRHYRYLAAA